MYTPDSIHRPDQSGASSTPLRDYLSQPHPGVDQRYAVLPRALVETMPLVWQQQMAQLLDEFHRVHGQFNWPVYRVIPSRWERVIDLDEDQLAEAGIIVEIDSEGDLVYRERNGNRLSDSETRTVLVSTVDPAFRVNSMPNTPARGIPQSYSSTNSVQPAGPPRAVPAPQQRMPSSAPFSAQPSYSPPAQPSMRAPYRS
jgi:hypothetical protein